MCWIDQAILGKDMILVFVPGILEFLSQDDVSNVLSSCENHNSNHKTKKKLLTIPGYWACQSGKDKFFNNNESST